MNGITTIRNITKTYRHINRYRQILHILFTNGFGFVFKDLKLYNPSNLKVFVPNNDNTGPMPSALMAERLRNTLIELGPTFVKLGQMLSCRPDIMPPESIAALQMLQEHVPPFPFEDVRRIVKEELGHEIEEIFSDFSDKPAGSASIAQGYAAKLLDGTQVFVKIQRPNILGKISVDLEILSYLASQLEANVPEMAFFSPTKVVEDFADSLLNELDFHNEAANMTAFHRQFAKEEQLVTPTPISQYCTNKVLTMTYINGIHARDKKRLEASGIDTKAVGELGVKLLLQQFFDFGFFHGDPHPGNMFILPGPKIAYIDFGVMGRLTQSERNAIKKLALLMYMDSYHEMAKTMLTMTDIPEITDADGLERDIASLVACHLRGNVQDLDVMSFIEDFYKVCYHRKLSLRPHFYSMLRALSYADAMGRDITPDFNIFEQLRPFIMKESLERLNLVTHTKGLIQLFEEWQHLAKTFPDFATVMMHQLKNGRFLMSHRMDDIKELSTIVNNSLRNLSASLVVAASIIASSLMLLAKVPPLFFDISILGLATFIISSIIGFIMLVRNIK